MQGVLLRVRRFALMSLGCALVGCSTTQSVSSRPFDSTGPGSADAHVAEMVPAPSDGIRIHSIQRMADGDQDSVTASVSIRNVSNGPRTVNVVIIWLGQDGVAIEPEAGTGETVTLLPQESREVTFVGVPGARDFKVSLAHPNG